MSLAEQVITQLKTDFDNVYDAGYQKGLKEVGGLDVSKFGIQNEVTSTDLVTCDYVNENEHNVEVKLSSDTITDFSGVEVSAFGKNWFDLANADLRNPYIIDNATGELKWYGSPRTSCNNYMKILPNMEYVAYAKQNNYSYGRVQVFFYDADKNYLGEYATSSNNSLIPYEAVKFTTPKNAHFYRVTINSNDINTLQIEVGTQVTPYKRYVEPKTYTPNADGTVDGVTSISPTMNIICDGVDISAKYYCMQDVEWQRFWDNYQDYGQRVNYEYAFRGVGWTDKTLKPKYKITPTYATGMCSNALITKVSTDIFDFSKTTTLYNAFEMASKLIEVVVNDMSLVTNANNLFYYSSKIQKINLGGINPSCSFSNAFYLCIGLVDFECSGSFGKSVSFQWCSLLTNESVQNIIDCLADLTGTTAQTITFHADVKAKLTEEQIATITSKNWTLA